MFLKSIYILFICFVISGWLCASPADKVFRGHKSEVTAVAISQGGKYLASGGSDGTIIVWDLINDVVVSKFRLNDRIFKMNFSYNSRELCVGTISEDYNPNILQPCIFLGMELAEITDTNNCDPYSFVQRQIPRFEFSTNSTK